MAISVALLVLGFIVMFLHLPAIISSGESSTEAGSGRSIWSYKHTVLGMVGIFFYVGLEVSLFANAIKFFETQGVDDRILRRCWHRSILSP